MTIDGEVWGYVLQCGNCGEELMDRNHAYLAHRFAVHVQDNHKSNVHLPTGFVLVAELPDDTTSTSN